jgi:hypothetical protein
VRGHQVLLRKQDSTGLQCRVSAFETLPFRAAGPRNRMKMPYRSKTAGIATVNRLLVDRGVLFWSGEKPRSEKH